MTKCSDALLGLILCPPAWAILPPAGLAYLAETAAKAGYRVFVYDLNALVYRRIAHTYRQDWTVNPAYLQQEFYSYCYNTFSDIIHPIIADITNNHITHIGFTLLKSNRTFSLALAEQIKQSCPDCKIVLGGPEVFTLSLEGSLDNPIIDYYVIGEGERALLEILAGNREKIYAFRQQKTLAAYPRYRAFDLTLYSGKGRLPIVASRGCLNRCTFCAERLLFKNYRRRTAEDLMQEIAYHQHEHQTNHFVFYDSLFNGHPAALEHFLDLLIASRLPITWEAQVAVSSRMPECLLAKMKAGGCVNLFIGLESGSDTVLQAMGKGFTAGDATGFLHKLDKAGLQSEIALITHFPGETEVEFQQTIDFIRQNKLFIKKIAQVSRFTPYPGTNVSAPPGYNIKQASEKIARLLTLFKEEGIAYTPRYIDNLI